MNILNPTELEFAAALAKLTPANPTPEQKEIAQQLLLAFNQKVVALQTVSAEYVRHKTRLGDLQIAVGQALAGSMKPLVQTPGQPTALRVVTNNEAAREAFNAAQAAQPLSR